MRDSGVFKKLFGKEVKKPLTDTVEDSISKVREKCRVADKNISELIEKMKKPGPITQK